jgi:hypothetical protein
MYPLLEGHAQTLKWQRETCDLTYSTISIRFIFQPKHSAFRGLCSLSTGYSFSSGKSVFTGETTVVADCEFISFLSTKG